MITKLNANGETEYYLTTTELAKRRGVSTQRIRARLAADLKPTARKILYPGAWKNESGDWFIPLKSVEGE